MEEEGQEGKQNMLADGLHACTWGPTAITESKEINPSLNVYVFLIPQGGYSLQLMAVCASRQGAGVNLHGLVNSH